MRTNLARGERFHVDVETRRDYCDENAVWTDGTPAIISGALQQFARVSHLKYGSCEYSWHIVGQILAKGGTFRWTWTDGTPA